MVSLPLPPPVTTATIPDTSKRFAAEILVDVAMMGNLTEVDGWLREQTAHCSHVGQDEFYI